MNKDFKLLDSSGNAANAERIRWVILINDGRDVLGDPAKQGLWWSYNKAEARRMMIIVKKDFYQDAYVRQVEEAIRIVAKRRYDIDLKHPYTYESLSKQFIALLMKGKQNGS